MSSNIQRSALSAALASINQAHLQFWQDSQAVDCAPYFKLLTKVLSFLRGELKSEANLLRFHDEFYQWREALEPADNLAYRILELCNAALHSAIESLFDKECDDTELILGSLDDCWTEMAELGADTQDLKEYWQEIQTELNAIVTENSKIPLPKDYFALLKELETSLFGV